MSIQRNNRAADAHLSVLLSGTGGDGGGVVRTIVRNGVFNRPSSSPPPPRSLALTGTDAIGDDPRTSFQPQDR